MTWLFTDGRALGFAQVSTVGLQRVPDSLLSALPPTSCCYRGGDCFCFTWTVHSVHLLVQVQGPPLDDSTFLRPEDTPAWMCWISKTDPNVKPEARRLSHQVHYLFTQYPKSILINSTEYKVAPFHDKWEAFTDAHWSRLIYQTHFIIFSVCQRFSHKVPFKKTIPEGWRG